MESEEDHASKGSEKTWRWKEDLLLSEVQNLAKTTRAFHANWMIRHQSLNAIACCAASKPLFDLRS